MTILSPIQLIAIRDEFVSKWKEYDQRLRRWEENRRFAFRNPKVTAELEPELPEFYPGYRYLVDMMEQIDIHATQQKFPYKLMLSRSPNETDAEYLYRKLNYKNTTAPVFIDYINTVGRCTSDQNWSLSIPDEQFRDYVEYEVPKYGSLEAYLRDFMLPLKTKDANGIIAMEPSYIPFVTNPDGTLFVNEQGQNIISDEKVKPVPVYYSCRQIIAQDNGEWYAVMSTEHSEVFFNGKLEKRGIILTIFDAANIYQIRQVGKYIDYQFSDPIVVYPHDLGFVPCGKLKGIPSLYEDKIYYVSPFSAAADLLDLVLLDESNLFVIKSTTVYNYKVAIGTPCNFERDGQRCRDGIWFDKDRLGVNGIQGMDIDCPVCLGAGLRPRMSPFGVLLVNPGISTSGNPDGDTKISGDYLKLIGPPIEAPKFLTEEIAKNTRRATKILHLPDADGAAVGGDGATPMAVLNKQMATFAFIQGVSNQLFDLFEFMLKTTALMRGEPDNFTLNKPQSFNVLSPADQVGIIGELSKLGLPPVLISAHIEKYLSSIMYNSKDVASAFKLMMNEDNLLSMSRDDINLRLTSGDIEGWRDTIHQSGIQIIKQLLDENERFFEQDYSLQREQFINKAKENTVNQDTIDPVQAAKAGLRKTAEVTQP